jgi:hypothetical protein
MRITTNIQIQHKESRFVQEASRIGQNISKVAVPAMGLIALASIPRALGDDFIDCMNMCNRRAVGALDKLICQTLCAVCELFRK